VAPDAVALLAGVAAFATSFALVVLDDVFSWRFSLTMH
jgi:hypothetical protein